MTADEAPGASIEFAAAITGSGNVWQRYATREEAQAFIDTAPAPMHVLLRQNDGDRHGPWVHA